MKAALVCLGIALSIGACKKSGGGGGSGWLVGTNGLMANVQSDGLTRDYPLNSGEDLNAIACRFHGEAWVVGSHGTLLYTSDAGATWAPQAIPSTADLRALATQDSGPVFVGGDGVLLTTTDTGQHWTTLANGNANFIAIAAAQSADTVLAVAEDGGLFSVENNQLVSRGSFAGARAVAVASDGETAILVGDHLISRSSDGGRSWTPLAVAGDIRFDGVRIDDNGEALAVGTGGAIAHVSAAGQVALQQVGAANLHALHIAEADDDAGAAGFAAGDDGRVVITLDGGTTWHDGPSVGRTVLGVDMIGAGHL
jgi:photosystem II stability/assembly factor-like uncharacterized protein